MRNIAAGALDRRILVQMKIEAKDRSGDVIAEDFEDAFRIWSKRTPRGPGVERLAAGGVLRDFDTLWEVRQSARTELIAPETHRILWHGVVNEIVGIVHGTARGDVMLILTAARPDLRGSRSPEGSSGQP